MLILQSVPLRSAQVRSANTKPTEQTSHRALF